MEFDLHDQFINSDFISSKIASAKKIDIRKEKDQAFIQLKGKDDNVIVDFLHLSHLNQIPLENIKKTEVICQRQYQKTDRLIQIVFVDERQRLQILRLDIDDSQIDEVHKITEPKGNNSYDTKLKACSQCGSNGSVESKFCAQCGHKFEFACSRCGNLNPAESLFCPNCGLGLKIKTS